jgi:hypothetical protein
MILKRAGFGIDLRHRRGRIEQCAADLDNIGLGKIQRGGYQECA